MSAARRRTVTFAALGGAAALAALASSVAFAPGCGGGRTRANLFAQDWSDDGGRSVEAARAMIRGDKPSRGTDVVVGVAASGDKLVGLALDGGKRWAFPHRLDARPTVAGDSVIASGGGEVFALDARTGKKLWARPTGGLPMRGAGADGSITVVTFAQEGGRGSVLLAVARDGSVVRQIETERELGIPAVVSGFAFVPWANQYVTILDLSDGAEAGRILVREKTSRAFSRDGEIYFGEVGLFRFDDRTKLASQNQATHLALPSRRLPGEPALFRPGTERVPPGADARDKVLVTLRPTATEGGLGFDSDRFYATYFRLVTGFEAGERAPLRWVHAHPVNVLAAAAAKGAFVGCDERGHVFALRASDGAAAAHLDLGEPLRSCVVHVEAYTPPPGGAPGKPLVEQLEVALATRDDELAAAQEILLGELATLEDARATAALLSIVADARTPPPLAVPARRALAERRNGAEAMKQALAQRYDYLRGVLAPPPVSPCARALAAMGDRTASALLASHLLEPANSEEDVRDAALALETLAEPEDAQPLREFLALARGTSDSDDLAKALAAVARTLVRIGGDEGRKAVLFASKDPLTAERHRSALAAAASPSY